jgi:ribosome-interacting GTPase 1
MTNKLQQIAEDNQFDIDLANLYCEEDNFDEFNDKVYEAISYEDVIYYSEAIKYLSREDASLSNSLDIASEYGYEIKDLNSELLATLLYQQKLNEQWYEISEQIEELFNN